MAPDRPRGLFRHLDDPLLRHSLRMSVVDAVLWAVMFGFSENYVVPFMLLAGATVFGVSLLQGLTQLVNAAAQLVGSAFIQRRGSRRTLSRTSVVVHGASWIGVAAVAAFTHRPGLAAVVFCAGLFVTNLSTPGWLSWMNDLVPASQRGLLWGTRNRIGGLAQLAATSLAGGALFIAKARGAEIQAYEVLFLLAAVSRISDVAAIGGMHEPRMHRTPAGAALGPGEFLRGLPGTGLGRFLLFMSAMSFLTMAMNPLMQVHLLKDLQLDYLRYTAVTMTGTIAGFLLMTYWGARIDRFGNRRVLVVTSAVLPLVAAGWVVAQAWPILLLLQLLNGFLFAGFNLAGSTYIYGAVSRDRLPKVIAYYQTMLMTAAFLGSTAGGAVATALAARGLHAGPLNGITAVFGIVALLRVGVVTAARRGLVENREVERSPSALRLLLTGPFEDLAAFLRRHRRRPGVSS